MYGVSSFSLSQDNQAYKDVVTLQHVLNMTKVFVAFPETCRHPGIVAKVLWPSLNSKTSQELRMLSSVTINCQVTKIVMNSGSQLSEL